MAEYSKVNLSIMFHPDVMISKVTDLRSKRYITANFRTTEGFKKKSLCEQGAAGFLRYLIMEGRSGINKS